jgi:hypothetical protein
MCARRAGVRFVEAGRWCWSSLATLIDVANRRADTGRTRTRSSEPESDIQSTQAGTTTIDALDVNDAKSEQRQMVLGRKATQLKLAGAPWIFRVRTLIAQQPVWPSGCASPRQAVADSPRRSCQKFYLILRLAVKRTSGMTRENTPNYIDWQWSCEVSEVSLTTDATGDTGSEVWVIGSPRWNLSVLKSVKPTVVFAYSHTGIRRWHRKSRS